MDNLYRLLIFLVTTVCPLCLFDIGIVRGLILHRNSLRASDVKKNMQAIKVEEDTTNWSSYVPPTPAVDSLLVMLYLGNCESCNLPRLSRPEVKCFAAFEGTSTEEIISVASRIRSRVSPVNFRLKPLPSANNSKSQMQLVRSTPFFLAVKRVKPER